MEQSSMLLKKPKWRLVYTLIIIDRPKKHKTTSGRGAKHCFMIRQSIQNVCNHLFKKNKFVEIVRRVPHSLKDQSAGALRIWVHQCECVLAQRLRRGQQMFSLYSKLWEEQVLRDFIMRVIRSRMGLRNKDLILGALGVAAYDWNANKISDSEIKVHQTDLEYIYKLKDKTICKRCSKHSRLCRCDRGATEGTERKIFNSFDNWKVFIEKKDLIVWRRLHSSGNYEYKVYGSYSDVSAEDFLNVQIDINYRKQWDATAVNLNVIETDPTSGSNSDIVYWEILWPKLFVNRDYVFHRRYYVDYQSKTLFLISKSTKHPSCPREHSKYRIEDYRSHMVIKPYTDLNKPGIEFSLTYFDNPGVNIPASVTTWVAMKAMPDFLERLRDASKKYKSYCQKSGFSRICYIVDEKPKIDTTYLWDYFDNDIVDNTIYEAHFKMKTNNKEIGDHPAELSSPIEEEMTSTTLPSTTISQSENHSFWRFIKRLFK